MRQNAYKITDIITIKLENEEINIYLDGELFKQCKAILLQRPLEKLEQLEEIDSIDDLAYKLEQSYENMDNEGLQIPLETHFWAHCSNIQTWVENDYDTRLLHSNLAFPLLKKLADLGDPRARQRFSEEVIKRFNEGSDETREYLIFQNYLQYIDDENKFFSILNEEDALLLISMIKKYGRRFRVRDTMPPYGGNKGESNILIEDKKIISLGLQLNKEQYEFPQEIAFLKNLSRIIIYLDNVDFFPPNIEFTNIRSFNIAITPREEKKKTIIQDLGQFPNIMYFDAINDTIFQRDYLFDYKKRMSIKGPTLEISEDIGKLSDLIAFKIGYFTLKKIPESICNLKKIKSLSIKGCSLNRLPEKILGLNTLEKVSFEGTKLEFLPLSLLNNQSIKYFSCEPYLITAEIKEWIKKRELEPFGEKAYRKRLYFQFL